jgi:hypothetical protein
VPVLIACTTSSIAKMLFSATAGTRAFAARVIPAQAALLRRHGLQGLWPCRSFEIPMGKFNLLI